MSSLQDILEVPTTVDPKPAADPQPSTEGQKPEEKPTGDQKPEDDSQKTVPLSDHVKQRQRRREAEDKAAKLAEENAFLRGQQSAQPQREPTEEERQAANEQFLENPKEEAQKLIDESVWGTRCQMSAEFMRRTHKDYDEVEGQFAVMVQRDPSLSTQLRQSPDPARFAYEYVKTHESVSQYGSAEEMEKAMYEKARKDIEAENKKKVEDELAKSTPTSQADAAGGGEASIPTPAVTSMADILGNPDLC